MVSRVYWRLTDIRAVIREIRTLLAGHQMSILASSPATRAAFERFLEIASEASRHVPEEWKVEFSAIEWRQLADLGNFLRHAYHKSDLEILWSIYENDLDPLEQAVNKMIERSAPPDSDIKT